MHNIHKQKIVQVDHQPSRETALFDLETTFSQSLGVNATKRHVKGFAKPGQLTPKIDTNFVFEAEELRQVLMGLEARDTIYLLGHSGTGKTTMIQQIAARLNYNVIQINFDGHLSRSDLVGDWKITNGEMTFRYGLVPLAFTEPGTILLFDEIDACPPETAFVLQRAISNDMKFLMHETNEVFELHPQNCIVGTANTNGMGDDTGLYMAGTNVQNFSFLNRWKTAIQVDYIKAGNEEHLLRTLFKAGHVQQYVLPVVRVLNASRDAFKNGTLSMPLTTRDGINWLEKLEKLPYPMRTARYSFLDKLPVTDAMAVAQLISRHIKLDDRDDKKYITNKK